ncbi:2-haloacrylate+reductase [Methylocapsa aurea]|uniref:NADP-dependent oxidoreductase n=1 Tax=Methylocapsa aurea TaxID=663610 RepID=UPI003D18A687
MRALQISSYGGPEKLVLTEIDKPSIGETDVLMRVAAAGMNPVDWKIREGLLYHFLKMPFPATLGNEVSGTVEAVGSAVSDFGVGDEVHGSTGILGGYAEFASVPAAFLARMPTGMDMATAAAMPVAVATSTGILNYANIGAGTKVLIHAASGGVGHLTLQLAKLRDATVTALASARNLDFVRKLGADHVVDRDTPYEDTLGIFDVVVDCFGVEAQDRSWHLLRKGGYMVAVAGYPQEEKAAKFGVHTALVAAVRNGHDLAAADALVEAGKLHVELAGVYPFGDYASAMQLETGSTRGKIVLAL